MSAGGEDDRQRQLEQEIADLRERIGHLAHEVIDLRASALLWRKLYEDAVRRLAEFEKGPGSGHPL